MKKRFLEDKITWTAIKFEIQSTPFTMAFKGYE
jgi:hypothetical protein